MSKINVVLATDANYMNYLEVTLKSLLAHNENLSVFVLNMGDISSEWEIRLQPYFAKRNSSLKLVYFDDAKFSNFKSSGYISTATYLRFYIPSIFGLSETPYWVYLDCDIVINGNIKSPIYENNISNYEIGAVSDLYVNSLNSHPYLNQDYFNAGVLYLNAQKLRKSFSDDLMELYEQLQEKIVFGDQDILNFYFKNNWVQLSKKYNFQLAHILHNNADEFDDPAIIHFTGSNKPLANLYFDNVKCKTIVSLFRLYNSLSWEDIVNLPIGTIKLRLV